MTDSTLQREVVNRELLELAIAAAGIGTFDWDLVSATLSWDDRLIDLFDYDSTSFDRTIESFNARVHVDDLERVQADLEFAISNRTEFTSEYRIVTSSGDVKWIGARGRTLCNQAGDAVRLLGAAWDATKYRESEAAVGRIIESMATAFFSLDTNWEFTYANAEAERMLGHTRSELVGANLWELFPAAANTDFETNYRHAMDTGETVTFDAFYPEPLNAWYEVRVLRSPEGLSVYFLDVTARRALQEQTNRAVERADLLSRITEDLMSSLNPAEAAQRLTKLIVPVLADWCVVTLVDDTAQVNDRRGLGTAMGWHRDPSKRDLVNDYARARLGEISDDTIVVRAMNFAQPELLATDALTSLTAMFPKGPALTMLTELDPNSVAVLPLVGRNGTVGLLSLCRTANTPPFTPEDFATARHIAGRAGLVLDNARLYRQQQHLAEELQRSMLTAPPRPEALEIAVRYEPAAEIAQVGGDWYDGFQHPDGSTVVAIGDVVGHDSFAASVMGQMRTLVRGIAVSASDNTASVLQKVDLAIESLDLGATATAVVARLVQKADHAFYLRWSNAGHPPPFVISPDGQVRSLDDPSNDVLLGVAPHSERHESEVELAAGATVLLYTDGLIERRGQSIDEGIVVLRKVLNRLKDRKLDDLCDELLNAMLPANTEDDVALVAVRLQSS